MAERGGAREGAGRKPKSDEVQLIETMDRFLAPDTLWEILAKKCLSEDKDALKLWTSYRFGMPKQTVATEGNMSITWNETLNTD